MRIIGMDQDNIAIVVDGCAAEVTQPFDARDVLRLGGILGDGIVIRVDGGRASRFDPERPIAFPAGVQPVFRTFRGAAHALWVDGLRWDWGSPVISEAEIRAIVGTAPGSIRFAEGGGPLRPDARLDLTTDIIRRLHTRATGGSGTHASQAREDGPAGPRRGGGHVLVRVDGIDVVLSRGRLTGAAVLAAAGAAEVDGAVLIRVDGGRARRIAADEALVVVPGSLARFRVHHLGEFRRFEVDGQTWEWGSSAIGEDELLDILIEDDSGKDVVLSSGLADIRPGTLIDLAADGSTRIVSRRRPDDGVGGEAGSAQSNVSVSSTTSKS